MIPIVDAHLDLGYNVQRGRDLSLRAHKIRQLESREDQNCMVTIPELREGGVALVFGSIFVSPREFPESVDQEFDPERAKAAKEQTEIYHSWEDAGHVRIIRDRRALEDHLKTWEEDLVPGLVVAMESAEPIESPEELQWWYDAGVRVIGLAWGPTRYCGGFAGQRGQAVGLTDLGRELVSGMVDLQIPIDLAHSSVELFWDALESDVAHVVVTHTVPRELIGVERMPDAAMIKALSERSGVVGLGLGTAFISKAWWEGNRGPVSLSVAGEVFEMLSESAGWDHVGIGSDLDGGIGFEESPTELDTIADLRRLEEFLPTSAREGVLGRNWLDFLGRALPA